MISIEKTRLLPGTLVKDDLRPSTRFVFFVPHRPKHASVVSRDGSAQIPVKMDTLAAPYVGIWWYQEDDSGSMALQGSGYLALDALTHDQKMADPTVQVQVPFYTFSLTEVIETANAIVTLRFENIDPAVFRDPKYKVEDRPAPILDKYNKDVQMWLDAHKQLSELDDVAAHWPECVFSVPHPSWKVSLPMWMFAMQVHPDMCTEAQLIYLMQLALYRLRLRETDVDQAHLREIFCEMASIYPLCMKYRLDHAGKRPVDQWISLAFHPCPARAGFDCEDGAELVLRMTRLITATATTNPLLKRVQSSVAGMEFCMCIGTLQLEKGVTWHAYVCGFERTWLMQFDKYKTEMKQMPLIIESTDYLTSDSDYTSPFCNAGFFNASPLIDVADDQGFQLKVPPAVLAETKQYHHIAMAFTPQFFESHGVPMVFFQEPGRPDALGVSVFKRFKQARITVPRRLSKKEIVEMKDAVTQMDLWLPRSRLLYGDAEKVPNSISLQQPDVSVKRYIYFCAIPPTKNCKPLVIEDSEEWVIFEHPV